MKATCTDTKVTHTTKSMGKDNKLSPLIPFIALSVLLLIFHIPLQSNFGDDVMFRAYWDDGSAWPDLIHYWHNWTSRIIIHFVIIGLAGLPLIVWKIASVFFHGACRRLRFRARAR